MSEHAFHQSVPEEAFKAVRAQSSQELFDSIIAADEKAKIMPLEQDQIQAQAAKPSLGAILRDPIATMDRRKAQTAQSAPEATEPASKKEAEPKIMPHKEYKALRGLLDKFENGETPEEGLLKRDWSDDGAKHAEKQAAHRTAVHAEVARKVGRHESAVEAKKTLARGRREHVAFTEKLEESRKHDRAVDAESATSKRREHQAKGAEIHARAEARRQELAEKAAAKLLGEQVAWQDRMGIKRKGETVSAADKPDTSMKYDAALDGDYNTWMALTPVERRVARKEALKASTVVTEEATPEVPVSTKAFDLEAQLLLDELADKSAAGRKAHKARQAERRAKVRANLTAAPAKANAGTTDSLPTPSKTIKVTSAPEAKPGNFFDQDEYDDFDDEFEPLPLAPMGNIGRPFGNTERRPVLNLTVPEGEGDVPVPAPKAPEAIPTPLEPVVAPSPAPVAARSGESYRQLAETKALQDSIDQLFKIIAYKREKGVGFHDDMQNLQDVLVAYREALLDEGMNKTDAGNIVNEIRNAIDVRHGKDKEAYESYGDYLADKYKKNAQHSKDLEESGVPAPAPKSPEGEGGWMSRLAERVSNLEVTKRQRIALFMGASALALIGTLGVIRHHDRSKNPTVAEKTATTTSGR